MKFSKLQNSLYLTYDHNILSNPIKMDFDDDGVIDVTEEEFFELTESMLEEDSNNCARYFWYNLQERRQGEEDVCDEPLFQNVDEEMFEVETIKKLIALHDNYEPVNFKQYTSNFIYTYKRLLHVLAITTARVKYS